MSALVILILKYSLQPSRNLNRQLDKTTWSSENGELNLSGALRGIPSFRGLKKEWPPKETVHDQPGKQGKTKSVVSGKPREDVLRRMKESDISKTAETDVSRSYSAINNNLESIHGQSACVGALRSSQKIMKSECSPRPKRAISLTMVPATDPETASYPSGTCYNAI